MPSVEKNVALARHANHQMLKYAARGCISLATTYRLARRELMRAARNLKAA